MLNMQKQKGYILALNIAVLALMFVAVSYMGQRMTLAINLARAEKQRIDTDYALESVRAQVMLILATVPRSRKGLGLGDRFMALDGRYYRTDHSALVSLQDIRGTIALNGVTLAGVGRERIERLLGTYGIDQVTSAALTDALLDYRDSDDLKRLNGAERQDYELAGKAYQLRNEDLIGVGELARILGWSEQETLWSDDLITRHVSVEKRSSFNPNTADWRALVAMSTIQEDLAKSLVSSRRAGEIDDISPLVYGGTLGDPFGPNAAVTLFPGATVIATLRKEGADWGYRMVIAHTPETDVAPWRIESVERVLLPPLDQPIDKLPKMPEISELRDLSVALRVQSPI
jgi:general secretion pathway protein K